jgi:hypothetical protein
MRPLPTKLGDERGSGTAAGAQAPDMDVAEIAPPLDSTDLQEIRKDNRR